MTDQQERGHMCSSTHTCVLTLNDLLRLRSALMVTNTPPACLGKQHFLMAKVSDPDLSVKNLRLSISSFTLENSRSQPSRTNLESLCSIRNCLWVSDDSLCEGPKKKQKKQHRCSQLFTAIPPRKEKTWVQMYLVSFKDSKDDAVKVKSAPT